MSQDNKTTSPHNDGRRVLLYLSLAGVVGLVLWTVVKTELRVRELVAQGFTDVAIDSTRNHAYFPMFGSLLGAAVMIGVVVTVKRFLRAKG
ncbi:hypothetical protein GCM10009093_09350 [Brevundimonas terrae]|uniref:DUF3185 family protein n=1 Tax=Brevundimonas terrae TaxID=363631 RepID=A0ABP3HZ30_9CAUL|nr:hypothetical protein [Brevundimonas terrae]NIJ25508.1 hypothetical protein [Brevundimonas terrae]